MTFAIVDNFVLHDANREDRIPVILSHGIFEWVQRRILAIDITYEHSRFIWGLRLIPTILSFGFGLFLFFDYAGLAVVEH